MRPRSMARSASQMVRLLESKQTVLKMGMSRICGVGPKRAAADVINVRDHEDGEDGRLADDERQHADAAARWQAPVFVREDGNRAHRSYFQSGSLGCLMSQSGRRLRTTGSAAKL